MNLGQARCWLGELGEIQIHTRVNATIVNNAPPPRSSRWFLTDWCAAPSRQPSRELPLLTLLNASVARVGDVAWIGTARQKAHRVWRFER